MRNVPLLLALAAPLLPPNVAPKIAFSESGRYEVKTTSGSTLNGSWNETQRASRSKLTMSAELPIGGLTIDGDTRLVVKVGGLAYEGALKDDPAYHPGATSARLVETQTKGGKSAVRTVIAKLDLKWNADRLTVKVAADGPDAPSVAVASFKDSQIGSFDALTNASVAFGDRKVDFDVPIHGRIARKSVDIEGLSGSATTVDLKGEAKGG